MNLALKKFKDRIQIWPQYDYAGIVSKVLESTHCKDNGLRPVISKICVEHMEDILGFNVRRTDAEVILFSTLVLIERTYGSSIHSRLLLINILSNPAIASRMNGKTFSLEIAISCTPFFGRIQKVCEMIAI